MTSFQWPGRCRDVARGCSHPASGEEDPRGPARTRAIEQALLDGLGELVERKGGSVLVTSAEQMPSRTGLAAIYRY